MSFWDSFNQMYGVTKDARTERAIRNESEAIRAARVNDVSKPETQTSFGPTGLGMTHTSPAQRGYEFMGQRYDERPDDYQQFMARQNAMGDLYEKYGLFDRADASRGRALQTRQYQDDYRFRANADGRDERRTNSDIATQELERRRTDEQIAALVASNGFNELTEAERVRAMELSNKQLEGLIQGQNNANTLFDRTLNARVGLAAEELRGARQANDFNAAASAGRLQAIDYGNAFNLAQTEGLNFTNELNKATKAEQEKAFRLANEATEAGIALTDANIEAIFGAEGRAEDMHALEEQLAKIRIDVTKMDLDQLKAMVAVNEQYQEALGGDPDAVMALVMRAAPTFNQHGDMRVQTNPDGEPVLVNTKTGDIQYLRETIKGMSPKSKANILARAQQYALLAIDGDVGRFSALNNAEATDYELGLRAMSSGSGGSEKPSIEFLNTTVQRHQQQLSAVTTAYQEAMMSGNLSAEDKAAYLERINQIYDNLYATNALINEYYGISHNGNSDGIVPSPWRNDPESPKTGSTDTPPPSQKVTADRTTFSSPFNSGRDWASSLYPARWSEEP